MSKNKHKSNKKACLPAGKEKGVSLYLALLIMTIFLTITLGLSAIFLSQSKLAKTLGFSVNALSAADTGIEKVLINRDAPFNIAETFLSNGASYKVFVRTPGIEGCVAANFCIKSIGDYKEIRRAIQINY